MKSLLQLMFLMTLVSPVTGIAQQTPPDSLLNKLIGKWILKGTIAGQETTHDVDAKRMLNGQYVQITEVSREKDEKGNPQYDAIVYICWQEPKKQYICLWLDNTSNEGISNQVLGRAELNGDKIEFIFLFNETTRFHNKFLYDKDTDTWQWLMDEEQNGKFEPFGRVKLTKN